MRDTDGITTGRQHGTDVLAFQYIAPPPLGVKVFAIDPRTGEQVKNLREYDHVFNSGKPERSLFLVIEDYVSGLVTGSHPAAALEAVVARGIVTAREVSGKQTQGFQKVYYTLRTGDSHLRVKDYISPLSLGARVGQQVEMASINGAVLTMRPC